MTSIISFLHVVGVWIRRRLLDPFWLRVYYWLWKVTMFRFDLRENTRREHRLGRRGVFASSCVMLFGDSQVAAWRMSRYFRDLPVISRGVDGDCSDYALGRFATCLAELQPSAVVVLIGINDLRRNRSIDEIARDVGSIVARAREKSVSCFLCSVLPVSGDYRHMSFTGGIFELNQKLKALVDRPSDFFVDYWSKLVDGNNLFRSEFTFDGLHPNAAGYALMTELLMEKLRGVLPDEELCGSMT